MKTASARVVGMVGRDDPITSVMAAEAVSNCRWTIRERVLDFARRCQHGFIDEEVGMLQPGAPESSYRKRRTELTDENVIVASTETRRNSAGQPCVIFYHRDNIQNPPPLRAREKKPSRFAALQERVAKLETAVATAIKVADEAREEWDKAPEGMKAGKLLIALSGGLPGYRRDIDSIHAALA